MQWGCLPDWQSADGSCGGPNGSLRAHSGHSESLAGDAAAASVWLFFWRLNSWPVAHGGCSPMGDKYHLTSHRVKDKYVLSARGGAGQR